MLGRPALRTWLVSLALLGALLSLGPMASGSAGPSLAGQQMPPVLAVVEVRQDTVQWRPAGAVAALPANAPGWRTVTVPQPLGAGDEIRTVAGGEARVLQFDGTLTELTPDSHLAVEPPDLSPDGALLGRVQQLRGTAVHHAAATTERAQGFKIETLAAVVLARDGATVRVGVGSDGSTRVAHLRTGLDGTVTVQATGQSGEPVALAPGDERVWLAFANPRGS
jgi:hypothetical protein